MPGGDWFGFFCEKGRPPGVCCLSPGLRRGLAFQGGRVVCFEMLRCRIVLEFLDGFCVIFSMACGIVDVSYKIFLSVWTFLKLQVLKHFPFFVTVIFMKGRFMVFSCFICVV